MDDALARLEAVTTPETLQEWFRTTLGRSGEIRTWKTRIGELREEDRKRVGQVVQKVGNVLTKAYEERAAAVAESVAEARRVDVTLPARHRRTGSVHPVTAMLRETITVFELMGFSVFESPHVEFDDFNFSLLNMAPHHPARDMQDTFYISEGSVLLRTHTSAGQVRAMREAAPGPLRVVIPGRCYRHEDVTPRAEMQFHQVEGLLVGANVRLSDLKGLLLAYARYAFGGDQQVRMRASYFPFTEPSVEVDIQCTICQGAGCRVCKQTGWLEMLGGGLVHPEVLRNGGYDPESVTGIAWGMGVERPLLLRHQINDIRQFFKNDLRFLKQF